MKKLFSFLIILCWIPALKAQTADTTSKKESSTAAYLRFPTVPPFKLLAVDSVTLYSKANLPKNKPVLVMLFSPACEHCQLETEQLVRNADDYRKIQIIMASTAPLSEIKEFYNQYKLSTIPGILVGRDVDAILPGFYMLSHFPYHALYDKKGKLLTTFEGSVTMDKILQAFD
jgi:thiol-disulfide isomerase/thioredoxin